MHFGTRRQRALTALAALVTSSVSIVAGGVPLVHAAAATVGNGITTSDLNVVGVTPTALANALVGPGVSVSNVSFTGANPQAGLVHIVDPAVVAFNDGIILSSGDIANVLGPNSSDSITGDMAGGADADLNALIQDTQTVYPMTFDAAVLQFDFVPTASPVYFTYTFGSDEYLEWVNLFNDVFAFYVNGTNCATVPSGSPVSIDTINDTVNPQLFRDNSFSSPPVNPINIESDGLSVEMICEAAVNVGITNHMKLAIADTSDQILDSVVMLKSHSLTVTPPESCNDSVDNDDDTLIDMDDSSCSSTTTPPPTGSSGVGTGGMSPAFTGVEGSAIVLDASALDWVPSADTVTTSWTVTGINGTVGTCEISPSTRQHVNADGTAAVVYAYCPDDGEYVARIDGWDVEGGGSWDTDVDFFVQNAPPSVSIDSPSSGSTTDAGVAVDISATVGDPGVSDTVDCSISWGDGSSEAGTVTDGVCTASHTYDTSGDVILSVSAIDGAGDAAAAAALLTVTGGPTNTAPVVDAGGPYTAAEGASVQLSGTASDVDGDTLTTQWSITAAQGSDLGSACTIANNAALVTTVVCNDNTTFTATLSATDGHATSTDTATVTTTNVAPTTSITAPAASAKVGVGTAVLLTAAVADAGTNDGLTCVVAWGDSTANSTGVISSGVCSATHTYTAASTGRTITVTTADDDSGSSSATRTVVVVAAPTVTGLSPTSGPVGTTVTLTGTNFTGATAVRFNGVPASSFTVSSATKITAVVAATSTTGTVSVTTPGGTATSTGSFTVTVLTPTITGLSPTSGPVGTTITITGTNLTGATAVKVNGLATSSFTVSSATKITAVVATGSTTGKVTVTTPNGTATSTGSFTVTVPAPTIGSFTPTTGGVGTAVTVTGTNFTGATAVKVNGVAATSFTVLTATTIVVGVPAGATSGKITVTTPGGTATSKSSMTVSGTAAPSISSLSKTSASIGATVTVTGTNVGAALTVKVNGISCSFTVTSATTIVLTVPTGATSGKVSVTTAASTATSTATLSIA